MKTKRRIVFRILKIIAAIIILLFVSVFIYVSVNKKEIIAQVTKDIEKKLNGKLTLGKVELSFLRNFPAVSVLLHDITLTDTMFSNHNHTFFKGKEVFVSLAITRLIRKQPPLKGIRIDDAQIYMYTDSTGYTNTYLMKGKKDSTKASGKTSDQELKKIELNNVSIIINDLKRKKYHDLAVKDLDIKVDTDDNITKFSSKTDILINSLAFNSNRGSFLKGRSLTGNFTLNLNNVTKQLKFDSIAVKISGQPFNLTGKFDLAGVTPQFMIRLHSRSIDYNFIKTLVPEKISRSLSIVELSKPLDVSAEVAGPLKGGEPVVVATWRAKDTELKTPFLDFENASFTGLFTNEVVAGLPRKDPNSKIQLSDFTASWHEMPVKAGNISINNLTTPELSCDLSSSFDLVKFNEIIGSNSLKLLSGTGDLRLNYKGPIQKNNNTNSYLNGDINFKNGTILYAPRGVEMKNVNCRMVFRNSDVFVENLQAVVEGQSIVMQGQAKNLLTLVNTEPDKANIDWTVTSPSLNLEAFTFMFASRNKVVATNNNKGVSAAATAIDNLLEQGRLHVVLKAGSLHYKNFHANNALADITLLQDRYIINKVSMGHAGGVFGLSGSLVSPDGKSHQAKLLVNMNNVNVTSVLKAFDNFGQDGITAENLEGILSTKADVSMILDSKGKVVPASVTGIIDFSLKDGALNNYEPIKKIQNFIFKKRDFDNIRFAELKNKLEIKDREIKINRMEIQSSVMSLYVEGVYSQKGGTDMSIQVPLSNLKKREEDFNPENLGADKRGGRSVFIRGRPGDDGTVKFQLDLFNKFDKDKEKEEEKIENEKEVKPVTQEKTL